MFFHKLIKPQIIATESFQKNNISELEWLTKIDKGNKRILAAYYKHKSGLQGEESILFKLQRCLIPMYVLHDITIDFDEFKSQIDFILITNFAIFLLECKNLNSRPVIHIDSEGYFTSSDRYGKQKIGMISPIIQNEEHLRTICLKFQNSNNRRFKKYARQSNKYFKLLTVFTGEQIVLDTYFAPDEIKGNVIKAEKLDKKLRKFNNKKLFSNREMKRIADFFVKNNNPTEVNNFERYNVNLEKLPIYFELQNLVNRRNEENQRLKTDDIFSIIKGNPKSEEELLRLEILSSLQLEIFKDEILKILNKYN